MWDVGLGLLVAAILLIPVSIKWELRLDWVAPWAIGIGLITGVLTWAWAPDSAGWILRAGLQAAFIVVTSGLVMAWRFYRDPERVPPDDPAAILSPADGRIVYITRFEAGAIPSGAKGKARYRLDEFTQSDLFQGSGLVIGIGMSFLDVHVNRAPAAGTVEVLKRIPGQFLSLKRPEALTRNERALTVIRSGGEPIGIVQIASRLVRSIALWVREGDTMAAGQRFGMIRIGSQVDLILPDSLGAEVLCVPGEQVYAGVTVVARRREVRG